MADMNGLLGGMGSGLLNDPLFMIGSGLLGSPSVGQGISRGLQNYYTAQNQLLQQQYLKNQVEEQQRKTQQAQRQAEFRQEMAKRMATTQQRVDGPPTASGEVPMGLLADPEQQQYYSGLLEAYPGVAQEMVKRQMIPPEPELRSVGSELVQVMPNGQVMPLYRGAPNSQTKVDVNLPANVYEKEEAKTVGKGMGERYMSVLSEGDQGYADLTNLRRAEQLVNQIQTGVLAPTMRDVKALAKGFGVDLASIGITDDAGPAQALDALSVQFALSAVNQTKGAVSDREMAMFQQTAPQLQTTPEGNREIIGFASKVAQRKIQRANMARAYYDQNRTYAGFERQWQDYMKKNPIISDADVKNIPQSNNGVLRYNPATGEFE